MKTKKVRLIEFAGAAIQSKINWRHQIYMIHAITARCNAGCEFCAWSFYENSSGELTTPQIKKLYSDARNAGFLALSIWGGEPLVHPDIGEITAHARELGFLINMVTNGFLLEKKMDSVIPNLNQLCVSVDYPSEQHDEVRRIKGLYEKILNAVRLMESRYPKLRIVFNCTLYKNNISSDSLGKMAELAKKMKVALIFNPLRDEAASEDSNAGGLSNFVASDDEISEAYTLIRDLKKRGFPIVNSYTYIDKLRKGPPVYNCHWPKFFLPIEANGDVVDCMKWGVSPVANVKDTPFPEILKNPRLRDLAGAVGESCHKCVSIHRSEVSEIYEGNLEPILAWSRMFI